MAYENEVLLFYKKFEGKQEVHAIASKLEGGGGRIVLRYWPMNFKMTQKKLKQL